MSKVAYTESNGSAAETLSDISRRFHATRVHWHPPVVERTAMCIRSEGAASVWQLAGRIQRHTQADPRGEGGTTICSCCQHISRWETWWVLCTDLMTFTASLQ